MTKSMSVLLILMIVLTSFSFVLSTNHHSVQLNDTQLQSSIGGQNAIDCAALLAVCLASTDSWWADILCIALAAACIVA